MKTILIVTAGFALISASAKAETLEQAEIDTEHALQRSLNATAQAAANEDARRARAEEREMQLLRAEAEAARQRAEAERRAEAQKEAEARGNRWAEAIAEQNRRHDEQNRLLSMDSDQSIKACLEAYGYQNVSPTDIAKVRAYMSAHGLLHVSQIGQ
jgi:uncharacterized membrane protein YqiK